MNETPTIMIGNLKTGDGKQFLKNALTTKFPTQEGKEEEVIFWPSVSFLFLTG